MAATIRPADREEWQRLAPTFSDYNYRQLWDYGLACARRRAAVSEHAAVHDGQEVLGIAEVRIKRIPLLPAGIAYVNGGPLVRRDDGTDEERLEVVLQALVQRYVEREGLVLRVQPPLGDCRWNEAQTRVFTRLNLLRQAGTSYRTLVLDLDRSVADLRKALDKQWRYNLKQAEKVPLVIRRGTSREYFDVFRNLHDRLSEEKRFETDLHPGFYAQVQSALAGPECFTVTLAEQDGQPIAGHICSHLGDTCVNLFRAMTEPARRTKASYLLQWLAVSWAHGRGCRWFDLGGIDPEGNPGVYHFKKGMGGIDVTAPGPFEVGPNSWSRVAVNAGERLYRWYRGAGARESAK